MKSFFSILLFLFLSSTALVAQSGSAATADPAEDPAVLEDPPALQETILVTASGAPESERVTPAATAVIERGDLEKRGVRDLADVLREVSGLVISRTGSPGKATSLFTRGANSTHTLVLWNGIEMNNPYFSGYNWGQFSTVGVDRVEVVKGPYSALYGSDAISGVVNILTSQEESSFVADVQGGDNGLLNGSASGSIRTERWTANAAYEHREDDGFALNDDFGHDSLLGGGSFSPNESLSIGMQGRFVSYELGIPRNVNAAGTAFVPTPDRREDGEETQFAIPVRLDVGRLHYELRLSRSARRDNFEDPEDPFFRTSASTDSKTSRAFLAATAQTILGTIVAGAEYEDGTVDDVSSYGANLIERGRTSRSLFAEDRLSLPLRPGSTLELAAGARYDEFDSFGSEISPRLAAAWVQGTQKIRAAYGQAFRAPAIGELYFPFFGNPDLQPERSESVEVGYDRYFEHRGSVSVTLFSSDYDDLIVYDNAIDRFGNIGAARSRGAEFGLSRRIEGSLWIAASYTWLDTEQRDTGETLLRRPRHSGSLSLGYDSGKLNSQLVLVHNGKRADVTDIFPYGRVTNSGYTTADVIVQYRVGAVTPYVRIENATDEKYEEVFGYPSAGRRFVAGVRYHFRPRTPIASK